MQISFVETMSGTVRDERGVTHPISFSVCAVGVRGGHFTLKGVITAPPWAAREVSCEGTLVISLRPRAITYHLTFDAAAQTLTLDAQKSPTPLHPLRSMTYMPTTIRDAHGVVVARGDMTFDLRHLPIFLASYINGSQQRQLDVRRRALDRLVLTGA